MFSDVSKPNIKGEKSINIKNVNRLVGSFYEIIKQYKTFRLIINF